MQQRNPAADAHATSIRRIAETLGVPVEPFPERTADDRRTVADADVVAAFSAIKDPAFRRLCLRFLRKVAVAQRA